MNKRILFFIFSLSLFLLLSTNFINLSSAQTISISPTPNIQIIQPAFVKYDLAYPGMLPDSPLYKLKVLRDKISAALIVDPKKKVDFYLLQVDKGILETAMLVDKNKIALAQTTALKAENNYTKLVMELSSLPKKPDNAFFDKLKLASLKHQEVLTSLLKRVPTKDQKTFLTVIDFSKRNWDGVEKYRKGD